MHFEDCHAKPLPLKGIYYHFAPPYGPDQGPDGIEPTLINIGTNEVTVKYTRNGKHWRATYAIRARDEGSR